MSLPTDERVNASDMIITTALADVGVKGVSAELMRYELRKRVTFTPSGDPLFTLLVPSTNKKTDVVGTNADGTERTISIRGAWLDTRPQTMPLADALPLYLSEKSPELVYLRRRFEREEEDRRNMVSTNITMVEAQRQRAINHVENERRMAWRSMPLDVRSATRSKVEKIDYADALLLERDVVIPPAPPATWQPTAE